MACPAENALVAFLEGTLEPTAAEGVEGHLTECPPCASLIAEFARLTDGESRTAPGGLQVRDARRLGRYRILDVLGAGGMGTVYVALDPELGRKVAIKVVNREFGERDHGLQARLLREAHAMARLAHPNVVAIHDVGVSDGQVFVAMELVDGVTLAQWSRMAERSWREVLDVMWAAGRGLAAAHGAGLIHRDFKPTNVLVGRDGRVRVTDFGLARGIAAGTDDPVDLDALLLETTLTKTGAMIGTPAYMAPEQLRRGVSDERSDQFSFCMTAYEALHGERPFAGSTASEILEQIDAGTTRPAQRRVPAWLGAALARGMRGSPDQRHASMDALLATFENRRARSRRVWIGTTAFAMAAVLATSTAWGLHRKSLCRGSEHHLDGVWDAERKQSVREAFIGTGAPYAEASWRGVEAVFDTRARLWTSTHRACCEATRLHGEQSDEVLGLRMACLRRELDEWKALTEVFTRADARIVEGAMFAAQSLRPIDACDEADVLANRVAAPVDVATATRVEALQVDLARAKAEEEVGRYAKGRDLAATVAEAARALRYRPFEAEALYRLGRLQLLAGDRAAAEPTLHAALDAAQAAGDARIAARTAIDLAAVAVSAGHNTDGHRWVRHATAALERAPDDQIAGRLAMVESDILDADDRSLDALAAAQRAVDLLSKARLPDDLEVAQATTDLAWTQCQVGRFEEGLANAERALGVFERTLGGDNPRLVATLQARAYALKSLGRYGEAIASLERGVTIRERVFGSDHVEVGALLSNLALVQSAAGRQDEAARAIERALRIFDPDHPNYLKLMSNLGSLYSAQERFADAEAQYRKVLAIGEQRLGPTHPALIVALCSLANVLRRKPDGHGALALDRRGVAIAESASGENSHDHLSCLLGLGQDHVLVGEAARGVQILERALALTSARSGEPDTLARVQMALARAIIASGAHRARAIELVTAARDAWVAMDMKEEAAEASEWLAAQAK